MATKQETGLPAGAWDVSDDVAHAPDRRPRQQMSGGRLLLVGNADVRLLYTITGDAHFAVGAAGVLLPAAQLVQDTFDLIGIGLLQRLAGLAEALTPY